MYGEWIGRTVNKSSFCSITLHIVQSNGTSSLSEGSPWEGYSIYRLKWRIMKIIVNFKWDCISSKGRWLMYFLSWTADNWIFSKTKLFAWLHWTHSLYLENPSCLQTTLASRASQRSSHTVPQALPLHTSTRPALELVPPRSLTAPWVQPTYIVTFYITV